MAVVESFKQEQTHGLSANGQVALVEVRPSSNFDPAFHRASSNSLVSASDLQLAESWVRVSNEPYHFFSDLSGVDFSFFQINILNY